uniref:Uncharacterized protein n=1 Tax=Anguilla anguilla TaxID=7936 RepID=A0A0E9XDW0_ANGAN
MRDFHSFLCWTLLFKIYRLFYIE